MLFVFFPCNFLLSLSLPIFVYFSNDTPLTTHFIKGNNSNNKSGITVVGIVRMIRLFLAHFLCIVSMGNAMTNNNPPSLRIQSIPIQINSTAFSLGIPTFQPSSKTSASISIKPTSTKAIIDKDNNNPTTKINVHLRSVSASPTATPILATRYPTGTDRCFSSYPISLHTHRLHHLTCPCLFLFRFHTLLPPSPLPLTHTLVNP